MFEQLGRTFLIAGLVAVALSPMGVRAQGMPHLDSDHDGVPDSIDAAPCDGAVSARVHVPADRTWGMLMFEDQWPARGDFDFNDAVIAWNQVLRYDSDGRLTGLRMALSVMAVGAGAQNGLALRLPNVPNNHVTSLHYAIAHENRSTAGEVRVDPQTAEATLILAEDLHALFGMTGERGWINTDPTKPRLPYVDIVVEVGLHPQRLASADAPFDLFLFNRDRGTEIHRPRYAGTWRMDAGLYNTADDGSAPGRSFVTTEGIPFVLEFPELTNYANETVSIDQLYPDIVLFGSSAGTQGTDFYRNLVPGHAYGLTPPDSLFAQVAPDTSCFTPDPGVCGAATGKGSLGAPEWNLCGFGTPSAVAAAGGMWRWTCAGNYSDPTPCNSQVWSCQPNIAATCSVPNGRGVQHCNGSGTGFGTCVVAGCNDGHYLSGNQCLPKACAPTTRRSCNLPNAVAFETCDNIGSARGPCTVSDCVPGFTRRGNACVPSGPPVPPPAVWPTAPQLYCNGGCSWDSELGCGQGDADIFCRLRTGNPSNYAVSYTTGTALPQGGYSCPGYGKKVENDKKWGEARYRGGFGVWTQATSILENHGPGTVINGVNCAF